MADDDLDRDDVAELVEELAPEDQRELVREVSESLHGSGAHGETAVLTDDVVGQVRDRFLEQQITDDYEALGKQLTLGLLSGAQQELAEHDEPVERVDLDLEAWIEPVGYTPPPGKVCFRLCIVNGILEPICWKFCIVNGIWD